MSKKDLGPGVNSYYFGPHLNSSISIPNKKAHDLKRFRPKNLIWNEDLFRNE
jgi:hypothetical protein